MVRNGLNAQKSFLAARAACGRSSHLAQSGFRCFIHESKSAAIRLRGEQMTPYIIRITSENCQPGPRVEQGSELSPR